MIFKPLFLFQTNAFETSIVEKETPYLRVLSGSKLQKSQLLVIIRVTKIVNIIYII